MVALNKNYVRPEILPGGSGITLRDSRHPVMEQDCPVPFIPNDAVLSRGTRPLLLLSALLTSAITREQAVDYYRTQHGRKINLHQTGTHSQRGGHASDSTIKCSRSSFLCRLA